MSAFAAAAMLTFGWHKDAIAQGYGMTLAQTATRIAAFETKTQDITRLTDANTNQTTVRFSGINVQVVDGTGATEGTQNGLGNLIIGYNDLRGSGGDVRTGNHNLIGGIRNNYSGNGGVVFGYQNTVSSVEATVTGGALNTASRNQASVTGGYLNTAGGQYASVSGGGKSSASGAGASVSGGYNNSATMTAASTAGGAILQGSRSILQYIGRLQQHRKRRLFQCVRRKRAPFRRAAVGPQAVLPEPPTPVTSPVRSPTFAGIDIKSAFAEGCERAFYVSKGLARLRG